MKKLVVLHHQKKNEIEGVEIFAEENFLEFKSYFESLKKRETVMVKAGINETFNVNLPKILY